MSPLFKCFELGRCASACGNIEGERFEQEVWLSRPLVGTDGLPGADVKVFIDGCRSWHNGGRLLNGTRCAPGCDEGGAAVEAATGWPQERLAANAGAMR